MTDNGKKVEGFEREERQSPTRVFSASLSCAESDRCRWAASQAKARLNKLCCILRLGWHLQQRERAAGLKFLGVKIDRQKLMVLLECVAKDG